MTTEKKLAHHAGARLYRQATGRFPSPEELARIVNGDSSPTIRVGMAAYNTLGDRETSVEVLEQLAQDPSNLGQVYQQLQRQDEKKRLGQVFTPQEAVDATLDLVGAVSPHRIIDPSCGAGDFLLASARRWPLADLEGVDIDRLALAVAKTRLILDGVGDVELTLGNALSLGLGPQYDIVLGNPPWGSKLSRDEARGYTISQGKLINSFVYFLELAAALLRPGGTLAFILPEAFIKVWGYQDVRAWLLHRFTISGLHYIPNLFKGYYAPAMLLSAVLLPSGCSKHIPVWYQPGLGQKKTRYNTLPPQAVSAQRFNINWHQGMESLWEHCRKGAVYLQEGDMNNPPPQGEATVDFSLGIVTGSNKDFVCKKALTPHHLPLLSARDVSPFVVAQPSHWLIYDADKLQQAAPLNKYQVSGKILYRFIARQLVTAVDYSGALTLNSLNIIIPLSLPFGLEYLAGLLNSKLLNTLYMYRFFTGKVLTRHIKQLPLMTGSMEQQKTISDLAGELAQGRGDKGQLDQLICDLYGLSPGHSRLVAEQHLKLRGIFFV